LVARRAGRRLVMAGIVQDRPYYGEQVATAVDGRGVIYDAPVGGEARVRTLGSARALLHLIQFDEPFGLSVIEAMACGTPVIAHNRGSMPELIEHGVTGLRHVQDMKRLRLLDSPRDLVDRDVDVVADQRVGLQRLYVREDRIHWG
jgi:glycosyltransferase involved in cell wall biosynthesis